MCGSVGFSLACLVLMLFNIADLYIVSIFMVFIYLFIYLIQLNSNCNFGGTLHILLMLFNIAV